MQYKQFKPGNLAFFKNDKVIIQSIHSMDGRTDIMFTKFSIFYDFGESGANLKEIAPIPLNKNVLVQLDFEPMHDKVKNKTYYQQKINDEMDKSFFIVEDKSNFEFCYGPFRELSFLHELQNLYFLKKNIELPIEKLLIDELNGFYRSTS